MPVRHPAGFPNRTPLVRLSASDHGCGDIEAKVEPRDEWDLPAHSPRQSVEISSKRVLRRKKILLRGKVTFQTSFRHLIC